jgi:Flp pilus assembly pilin Flp
LLDGAKPAAAPDSGVGRQCAVGGVRETLLRLVRDDAAQDLVEYALLLMFVGVTFLAVWTSISNAILASYTSSNAGVQGLWDPPEPGGTPP